MKSVFKRHHSAGFNFVFVYSFFSPLSPIELEDSDQTTLLYCQTHPRPILTSLRLSVLLQVPHRGIKAFYVLYHMSVNF